MAFGSYLVAFVLVVSSTVAAPVDPGAQLASELGLDKLEPGTLLGNQFSSTTANAGPESAPYLAKASEISRLLQTGAASEALELANQLVAELEKQKANELNVYTGAYIQALSVRAEALRQLNRPLDFLWDCIRATSLAIKSGEGRQSGRLEHLRSAIGHLANMDDLAVLSVGPNGQADDIKRAFKSRTLQFHPDKNMNLADEVRSLLNQVVDRLRKAYQGASH